MFPGTTLHIEREGLETERNIQNTVNKKSNFVKSKVSRFSTGLFGPDPPGYKSPLNPGINASRNLSTHAGKPIITGGISKHVK